jgi:class 3 adenylate cyclase
MLAPFDRVLATVVHLRIEGDGSAAAFLDHAARESEWFRGQAIESSRERFVAAFDGPARAIRCATALAAAAGRFGVAVRIGIHTGECTMSHGKPTGPPLDLASAIAGHAAPGEVLVSRTVRDIVGDAGLQFEDHGVSRIGDHATYRLYSV